MAKRGGRGKRAVRGTRNGISKGRTNAQIKRNPDGSFAKKGMGSVRIAKGKRPAATLSAKSSPALATTAAAKATRKAPSRQKRAAVHKKYGMNTAQYRSQKPNNIKRTEIVKSTVDKNIVKVLAEKNAAKSTKVAAGKKVALGKKSSKDLKQLKTNAAMMVGRKAKAKPPAATGKAANNAVAFRRKGGPLQKVQKSTAANNILPTSQKGNPLAPGSVKATEARVKSLQKKSKVKNNIVPGPRADKGKLLAKEFDKASKPLKAKDAVKKAGKKLEKDLVRGNVDSTMRQAIRQGDKAAKKAGKKGVENVRSTEISGRIANRALKGTPQEQQKKASYGARAFTRLAKRATALGDKKAAAEYRDLASQMREHKNMLNNVLSPKERYKAKNRKSNKRKPNQ
jgi:hypothetical protein